MEIEIGGIKASTLSDEGKDRRLAILLWGSSGCGKTELAATAPGKKLWLLFDPDGLAALGDRDDIIALDLFNQSDNIVEKFKQPNPLKIGKFLEENPDVETVVIDSMTTFGEAAVSHGVTVAKGTSKGKSSTIEDPGFAGWGNKNTWVRLCVKNLLEITAKYGRHCIIICHEDKPVTNDQGVVLFISLMLGSSLNEQVPVRISEVWHLNDTGKKHIIAVRPCRQRKPMRTRMFQARDEYEFEWKYDPVSQTGEGIALWFEKWKANHYRKIDLPPYSK